MSISKIRIILDINSIDVGFVVNCWSAAEDVDDILNDFDFIDTFWDDPVDDYSTHVDNVDASFSVNVNHLSWGIDNVLTWS